MQKVMELNYTM